MNSQQRPDTGKPYVSATQLGMFWRCPAQYERRYIMGEVIPPGLAMIQGSAVHKGAEVNFNQKIETHVDLPCKEIVDVAAAEFDMRKAGGYLLTEVEEAQGSTAVLGKALDETVKLAAVHATEQAPDYQPTAVEHFSRIVFRTASRDLVAYSDLWDDRDRITDFKTAKRAARAADIHTSTQLTIYAAAFQIEHGRPAVEVRLDTLIKTKKPGRQVLAATRTIADFRVLAARVNETLRQIEAGIFPPCSPDNWCCDPRYCGFWMSCRFVNQERRFAAQTRED
jgi:hypothetical protein